MASEAKKIRVFEVEKLTREEENILEKLGKKHKFTDYTPRYKIYCLKQFALGLAIINLLVENNQTLALWLIINYLASTKDFVNIAACAHPDFLKIFWYKNSKVFQTFNAEIKKNPIFHGNLPCQERLLKITSGEKLLKEYYLFKIPKINWKIDHSKMLQNSGKIECVAFNLIHPLVSIVCGNKIYILAYGGEARKERGQILFVTTPNPINERYYAINWSPSGDYLLAMQGDDETTRISLFYFDAQNFCASEISISPVEQFVTSNGLNTKNLWIDESTFMFATSEKYVLAIIKIDKETKKITKSYIELSKTMSRLDVSVKSKKMIHLVSNFFVMPNPESTYIFFLCPCGKDHQHHRVLYINKITLEVEKWVNLPGEVLEIAVTASNFFVLIQERMEESYSHNAPWMDKTKTANLIQDFSNCSFSEPWRSKRFSTVNEIAKTKIIKCTENSTELFRPHCCSRQLTGIASTISQDSNKKYNLLKEVLTKISQTNKFYVTNDFLYYSQTVTDVTHVFGLHHHFYFNPINSDEFLLSKNNNAWFHPTKPIFIQKTNLFYFNIYLNYQRATEKERREFPVMSCFNYKSQVVFSSSS